MSRAIVIGGAGFIGSHLVKSLCDDGYDVLVIDNLSTGEESKVDKRATLVKLDINYVETAISMAQLHFNGNIDEMYHLAALARIQRSWDHPELTYHANVNGTKSALELARRLSIRKSFITSSSSVFAGVSLNDDPFAIPTDHQQRPLNPYAWHKHMDERLAAMYRNCFHMSVKVGRPFNVYGEGQNYDSDYSTVIPKFAEQAKNGEELTVYGDGAQTRDFTYVGDVVRMMRKIAFDAGSIVNEYNLCSGEPTSIVDVAKAFDAPYTLMENPRKGEASWTWGDNNTGIKPSKKVTEWIKETYGTK